MFETLLRLRGEHYADDHPLFDLENTAHSLLLHGPSFSGKMTHALEGARRRSCTEGGSIHCQCSSCRDFSTYSMKNVVILSARDHEIRIRSALGAFQRLKTRWCQMYLVKCVRILLMSYHEALVGTQDTKGAALFAQAGEVDLLLDEITGAQPEDAVSSLGSLEKALAPLFAVKKMGVSIDAIRSLHAWMYSTSIDDLPRFAIIEGIGEATVGANNAILKMLEEPADKAYFFLLAQKPLRLLPTILSRVQKHYILPLSEEERKNLLESFFFTNDPEITSLRDFTLKGAGYPLSDIQRSAGRFASSLVSKEQLRLSDLDEMFSPIDSVQLLSYYLEQVMGLLQREQREGRLPLSPYSSALNRIRESSMRAKIYNQQVRTYLDGLYYDLAAVI